MSRRHERTGIAPALLVSAVLHVGALAAIIVFGALFKEPFKIGGGVPVTLVADGPPEFIQAEVADTVQEAQTEEPDPVAPPEPESVPTPAATPTPTPKPTPTPPKKPTVPGKKAELDLDRLLSDVETSAPAKKPQPPKKGGGKPGPKKDALTVQVGSGKRVSAAAGAYLGSLGKELSRRWNPNCLVEGGADVRAVVRFRISFGGKLLGRPVSSEAGTTDPMIRVASERAIRAVYAAEPFENFPPELYGEELIFPFDAPAACANR